MENETELKNLIDKRIREIVPDILKGSAFTDRKLTDTPTDNLSVVNRNYVNLNGVTRPSSSVVGQHFFDLNLASGRGKDITWNGIGWVDGTGAYV